MKYNFGEIVNRRSMISADQATASAISTGGSGGRRDVTAPDGRSRPVREASTAPVYLRRRAGRARRSRASSAGARGPGDRGRRRCRAPLDAGPRGGAVAFTIAPPRPTRIRFCDSVSQISRSSTTVRAPRRERTSPTSTATAWGTSSRVSRSACSRTSSAMRSATGWSVVTSSGK